MLIGTITFHGALNFGSALQAYALQSVLTLMGHEVRIIDYRARDYEQYRLLQLRHPKTTLRVLCRLSRFSSRKASFKRFANSFYNLTSESVSWKNETSLSEMVDKFDCFICGSDQIWNLDCTVGVVEPYFLSFAGNKRRVAYAPSLAHTSFKPENFDKELVARLLSKFDYLSVREEETIPLFQPLVDKPIDVVLDPTLLLNAADYAGMTSKMLLQGEYIFMYLLRECPELIESTAATAETTGMKVAYISEKDLDIPNSVNLFGIGPEEFVSLIAHASLIFTNSFHATVFSVLFHRPFRVYATDKSGARMRDLLSNIGLSDRCVDVMCADDIAPCDWSDVDSRLDSLREHSWAYLRKALS